MEGGDDPAEGLGDCDASHDHHGLRARWSPLGELQQTVPNAGGQTHSQKKTPSKGRQRAGNEKEPETSDQAEASGSRYVCSFRIVVFDLGQRVNLVRLFLEFADSTDQLLRDRRSQFGGVLQDAAQLGEDIPGGNDQENIALVLVVTHQRRGSGVQHDTDPKIGQGRHQKGDDFPQLVPESLAGYPA